MDPSAQSGQPNGEEPPLILLVDDEPSVLKLFGHTLRNRGYRVCVAANAEDAITAFEAHRGAVKLLVTDIVMPGMNGIQLAAEIRRRVPRTKVLYISGYPLGTLAAQGLQVDRADGFLQKPFAPAMLAAKVRELIA